jgi:hypothetical protein
MIDKTIFNSYVPPTIQDVTTYFRKKGIGEEEAEIFFLMHEKRQWATRSGRALEEWKTAARRWIAGITLQQQC